MDASKVFIGKSDSCDFEDNIWTFRMKDIFNVGSGEYAIMRLADYRKLLELAGETAMPLPKIKPITSKPFICHKHG